MDGVPGEADDPESWRGPGGEEAGRSDDEDAERAQRLRGDAMLVEHLRRSGFRGPDYDRFAEGLVRYGRSVLMAWLATGEIFARCGRRGFWLRRPARPLTHDDRESLATDTVVSALVDFRSRALIGGGWQPSGPATLTTYFAGGLPNHFPNVYRAWQRTTDKEAAELPVADVWQQVGTGYFDPHRDPQEIVAQREAVLGELNGLDPVTARVLALAEDGYQHAEIAELVGVSARAVEGRLRRHRQARKGGAQ